MALFLYPSFLLKLSHSCCSVSSPGRVCCSQRDGLAAGLRLAGISGGGLVQPPVQSKAGYSSLLWAASSCLLSISKHGTSTVSLSSLLLICTLYLQKPRVPLLCRNSKRHLSAASTDNAAFHLLCNCRRFWRTPISAGLTQGTGSSL